MADVQNIITDGIGSTPRSIRYFVLSGLDINSVQPLALATASRDAALTAGARSVSLTPETRGISLTPETRP